MTSSFTLECHPQITSSQSTGTPSTARRETNPQPRASEYRYNFCPICTNAYPLPALATKTRDILEPAVYPKQAKQSNHHAHPNPNTYLPNRPPHLRPSRYIHRPPSHPLPLPLRNLLRHSPPPAPAPALAPAPVQNPKRPKPHSNNNILHLPPRRPPARHRPYAPRVRVPGEVGRGGDDSGDYRGCGCGDGWVVYCEEWVAWGRAVSCGAGGGDCGVGDCGFVAGGGVVRWVRACGGGGWCCAVG